MVFGFVMSPEVKKINSFLHIQSSHSLSRGKGKNITSCFLQVIRFKLSSFC